MRQFGDFQVDVWDDGYPIWCLIRQGDQELRFSHDEIQHIEAAVREIRRRVTAKAYREKDGFLGRLASEMGPRG